MKFRKQSCYKENAPPLDKNIILDSLPSKSSSHKPSPNVGTRLKSLFPSRPNLHNPLKKKLMSDVCGSSSTSVKDELIRIKSTGNQVDPGAGYSTRWNTRRSLNVSKYSLHHPLILPHVDADADEEMEIVDETEHATVPSNDDNKSNTPVERKDSADSDIAMEGVVSESAEQRFEMERARWNEDLECELEASRLHVEKLKHELHKERKCSKELKDAMKLAMEGRARMLEQYADLEDKCTNLLTSQKRIEDGIVNFKKAAARAGVRDAESKFINALAAETSTLKEEREEERLHDRDENKGLQIQVRDTAEAVQAVGELLVRLQEAEEAAAAAEARAREAEQEKEKAYKEIESLKRKQDNVASPPVYDIAMYDDVKDPSRTSDDPQWRNEFENFYNENESELKNLLGLSSWSSGYDTCNI